MSTLARLLQTTVEASLTGATFTIGTVAVYLANEDKSATPRTVPSIVVTSKVGEIDYTRASADTAGLYARDCELRLACRVDGSVTGSAEALGTFAEQVRAAADTVDADWELFQPFEQGAEESWEGNTRILTLVYRVFAIPAV